MSDLLADYRHPDLAALYRSWKLARQTSEGLPSLDFGREAERIDKRCRLVCYAGERPANCRDLEVNDDLAMAIESVLSQRRPLVIEHSEQALLRVATALLPLSDGDGIPAVLLGRFMINE